MVALNTASSCSALGTAVSWSPEPRPSSFTIGSARARSQRSLWPAIICKIEPSLKGRSSGRARRPTPPGRRCSGGGGRVPRSFSPWNPGMSSSIASRRIVVASSARTGAIIRCGDPVGDLSTVVLGKAEALLKAARPFDCRASNDPVAGPALSCKRKVSKSSFLPTSSESGCGADGMLRAGGGRWQVDLCVEPESWMPPSHHVARCPTSMIPKRAQPSHNEGVSHQSWGLFQISLFSATPETLLIRKMTPAGSVSSARKVA